MKLNTYFILTGILILLTAISYGQKNTDKLSEYDIYKELKNINNDKRYQVDGEINDNYIWFFDRLDDTNKRKYGIAHRDGTVLFPTILKKSYSKTSSNNTVIININGKLGILNLHTLEWDIALNYTSLTNLNDMYIVKTMNSYGVVDSYNEPILETKWGSISSISGLKNYVIVKTKDSPSLYGIYNLIERKFIIPCKYQNLYYSSSNNYFTAKLNDKYNFIDLSDSTYFKNWYDKITPISSGENYIVKSKNLFGVINSYEETIIPT